MNKKGTIAKILPDGFVYTLNIVGIIIGTIIAFVVMDWGEWYADFDVEPVGLITLVLTIVLLLLPIALCLLIGGGIGYLTSFVVGIAIDTSVYVLVLFVKRKTEEFNTRKAQKRASKKIKQSNKSISEDVKRLRELKAKLNDREHTKSTCNLCYLINGIIADKTGFKHCLEYSEKQYHVLHDIEVIEKKIVHLANQYKVVNDIKNADNYFNIVNTK